MPNERDCRYTPRPC
jgi:hypothetical protein